MGLAPRHEWGVQPGHADVTSDEVILVERSVDESDGGAEASFLVTGVCIVEVCCQQRWTKHIGVYSQYTLPLLFLPVKRAASTFNIIPKTSLASHSTQERIFKTFYFYPV